MLAWLRRFLHWLGSTETDREIKSGLRDCMRFLVFLVIAGGSIFSGAEDFDWSPLTGEGRTSILMALGALGGSKWMK